jgi:hypothetical protein
LAAFLDLPAQPGFRLRVAPYPAPFLLSRRPIPRVAPRPRSSAVPAMIHSSFPELLMPSTLLVSARFRVSPVALAPSCNACDTDFRLPLVLYLRLYRRWIVESPRFSYLSAVPVVKAPGCPFASRPRYRRRSVSGLPRMLILRYRLTSFRVTSNPRAIRFALVGSPDCSGYPSLASPLDPSSSRPESSIARRRRFGLSRVAPKRSSSADPYLLPQVAPASASTAGSMMSPWLNRTLHLRLAPRMNLRVQSSTSIPDLASGALSISIHPSTVGRP